MILILISFIISFYLFNSACKLHKITIESELFHYKQQAKFYDINQSEVSQEQQQLMHLKNVYDKTYIAYNAKLSKIEIELQERIDEYTINNKNIEDEILKDINDIDITSLKELIMENTYG